MVKNNNKQMIIDIILSIIFIITGIIIIAKINKLFLGLLIILGGIGINYKEFYELFMMIGNILWGEKEEQNNQINYKSGHNIKTGNNSIININSQDKLTNKMQKKR